jgi:hypothetical protein
LRTGKWVHPKNKTSGNSAPTAQGIEGVVNMLTGRRALGDDVEKLRGENDAIGLCETVDSNAYTFTRVKGGTKMPEGGIQLGVREDYEEVASTLTQNTNDEHFRVLVTYRQGVNEKNEIFEMLPSEIIVAVVRIAYFDALMDSLSSQSDNRLTPTILARSGRIFWSLVYLCTNGGVNKKNLRDMLHGTFQDLDWGHLERDGRMRAVSDLTMNKALRMPLPVLMKRERKLGVTEINSEKYSEVIKLSAHALANLKVANECSESPNKNLISNTLFLVQFSLGDDFKYDQDDDIDSDEDDHDEDDRDEDDSDEDDSDDDDVDLMLMSLMDCEKRLKKSASILYQEGLERTFIDMIIMVLEAIRCLFDQIEDNNSTPLSSIDLPDDMESDGMESLDAPLACLEGARNVAFSLMGDVRGPGTMLITSLTFALSAWFVHHNEGKLNGSAGKDDEAVVVNGSKKTPDKQVLLRGAVSWLSEFQAPFGLYFSALMLSDKAVEEKDARDMRKFVVDFNRAGASICDILDKMKDDDSTRSSEWL